MSFDGVGGDESFFFCDAAGPRVDFSFYCVFRGAPGFVGPLAYAVWYDATMYVSG